MNCATRGLEFSAPPPDLQGGEKACKLNQSLITNDLINHDCNEASIETQNVEVWRISRLMDMELEWECCDKRAWKHHHLAPCLALSIYSIWLFLSYIYPFIINSSSI